VGVACRNVDGVRDAVVFGGRDEQLEHLRADRRAAVDDRARAQLRFAVELRVPLGDVGGARDVDRERDLRLEGEQRRARTAVIADLLLHGGHRGHVAGRASCLGDRPRRFQRDVGAEPVVQRPRCDPAAGQLDRLPGDHGDVTDLQEAERLLSGTRADVHVQVVELDSGRFLAGLRALAPLAADHAGNGAASGEELEPLSQQDIRPRAADREKGNKPVLVDVRDQQPDLVDVAEQREQRPAARSWDPRDRRAQRVARHLGEPRRGLTPDGSGRRLVAGRAGRGEQPAEKLGNGHGPWSLCRRLPFLPWGSVRGSNERSMT
jgi:hypothetical protein